MPRGKYRRTMERGGQMSAGGGGRMPSFERTSSKAAVSKKGCPDGSFKGGTGNVVETRLPGKGKQRK